MIMIRNTVYGKHLAYQVSQKITESMELTEVSSYKALYARLAAAMAVVRGAYADIMSSEQDQERHSKSFPHIHLERRRKESSRIAIQEWKDKSVVLMEKMHTEVQSCWSRARDAFAEIRAVLVEGDLFFEHFKLLLRSRAANFIDRQRSTQLQDLLYRFYLGKILEKEVPRRTRVEIA